MTRHTTAVVVSLLLACAAIADEEARKGYFRQSTTPVELLGEQGAAAVASVFAPDDTLTWQLSVPRTYDPAKPAGVIVFIGWADEWGGGKKNWTPILEERNIIWIGLIGGGDKTPINERMLKALLAQALLEKNYNIDLDRYYLFGYSGGAHVAAMLATSRPELFKGAMFYAGALPWGDKAPAKIDLVRQNRYLFMAGSLDDDRRKILRVAESYQKAGVANAKYVLVSNYDRKLPPPSDFDKAVAFLDGDAADK